MVSGGVICSVYRISQINPVLPFPASLPLCGRLGPFLCLLAGVFFLWMCVCVSLCQCILVWLRVCPVLCLCVRVPMCQSLYWCTHGWGGGEQAVRGAADVRQLRPRGHVDRAGPPAGT